MLSFGLKIAYIQLQHINIVNMQRALSDIFSDIQTKNVKFNVCARRYQSDTKESEEFWL